MKYIPKINTVKQLEKLLADQKQKITRDVPAFVNDTPEKQKRRINRAKKDRLYFYRTYLPHYFTKPFNWHHKEIDTHCDLRGGTITLLYGARETGKSVLAAVAYPIHQGCYVQRNFISIVSQTEDLAIERLIAIRAEFDYNPRILQDFGKLEQLGLWEMDDFTTKTGTRYLALGYKTHIRGKLRGPHRIDLLIPEDMENKRTARNPKTSMEIKEFLIEEAYGTLDPVNGNMIGLFNMPGKNSAANLLKMETEQGHRDGKFNGKRFILWYPLELPPGQTFLQNNSRYLWPEVKGEIFCNGLIGTVGTLAYQREFMLLVVTEGRKFKENWFREYKFLPKINRAVMYSDPAFGKTKQSSMKGIIILGWTGDKYITVDAWLRHETIGQWIDAQYDLWKRWRDKMNLYNHFIDDNFEQLERLKHDYNFAATRHQWRLPVTPDKFRENKVAKIEALSGLIENGHFEFDFSNPDQREIKEHLIYFPDHIYTEGGDLLASAKRVLDTSNVNYKPYKRLERKMQRRFLRG